MSGAADMEARLRDAISQLRERGKSAALSEGQRIMQRSNDEFAPKRTGALIEDSGVELVDTDDNSIEVVLWYGRDKAKDYTLSTHETPSKHDPPSWKGVAVEFRHGQAKYLERPLRDAVKGMAERLAKDIGTLVLVGFLVSGVGVSSAQVSGISAKAFPQQITVSRLPIPDGTQGIRIITNALSDSDCTVGGGTTKLICFDNGEWIVIGQGGEGGSDDQTASEVSITDTGSFYSGLNVESALQEIGADSRWTNARTPLAHTQAASTITDFTSASQVVGDARYSLLGHTHVSSDITDFTSSVQTIGDTRYSLLAHLHNLQDLNGAVTDLQVPNTITISGTPSKCARYDADGNLVPSSGDCPSGDTTGSGGVTGPSSSTANSVATYFDTTGSILLNNPGVTIPTPGNLLLSGTIGIGGFDSSHATIQSGLDRNQAPAVRVVRGDQNMNASIMVNSLGIGGGSPTSTTDLTVFADASRNELTFGSGWLLGFSSSTNPFADADIAITRLQSGWFSIDSGRTQNSLGNIKTRTIALTPGSVGSCGSGEKGFLRVAVDGTLCSCNGSTWTPTPLTGSCV